MLVNESFKFMCNIFRCYGRRMIIGIEKISIEVKYKNGNFIEK